MLELEWPSLEVRRDPPSLLLFPKIHCALWYLIVSIPDLCTLTYLHWKSLCPVFGRGLCLSFGQNTAKSCFFLFPSMYRPTGPKENTGFEIGQSDHRRIPQDTAGSLKCYNLYNLTL